MFVKWNYHHQWGLHVDQFSGWCHNTSLRGYSWPYVHGCKPLSFVEIQSSLDTEKSFHLHVVYINGIPEKSYNYSHGDDVFCPNYDWSTIHSSFSVYNICAVIMKGLWKLFDIMYWDFIWGFCNAAIKFFYIISLRSVMLI